MMIQVENLVKRYGDLIALDHLNLTIEEGEIFGLLGPNGSGKTTAMNCILALLKYDKGSIRVFGEPMNPNSYASKREIGVVLQNVAVFEELTVRENIDYFCGLYVRDSSRRKELVEEAVTFVGLQDFTRFLPKKLSGGLLRRLNIACGIAHKPKLIFLDEPTVAVDPQSRNKILEGIRELNRQGATVIYTTHYMEEVEQLCSRIAIMDKGRTIATGTKDELMSMIKTGETIRIHLHAPASEKLLREIRELPHVFSVSIGEAGHPAGDTALKIQYQGGKHNLIRILDLLRQKEIPFGQVYSELPTLNDVFLEITGKELRD